MANPTTPTIHSWMLPSAKYLLPQPVNIPHHLTATEFPAISTPSSIPVGLRYIELGNAYNSHEGEGPKTHYRTAARLRVYYSDLYLSLCIEETVLQTRYDGDDQIMTGYESNHNATHGVPTESMAWVLHHKYDDFFASLLFASKPLAPWTVIQQSGAHFVPNLNFVEPGGKHAFGTSSMVYSTHPKTPHPDVHGHRWQVSWWTFDHEAVKAVFGRTDDAPISMPSVNDVQVFVEATRPGWDRRPEPDA